MEHRALGKGLSALIPDQLKAGQTDKVTHVKTDLIRGNSQQPRTHYADDKLEELKASIREKGILQPILIRERGDGYEVIAGERRLKAARALKLDEIPVIIKNVSDQEALVIALVENIQREELNAVEEAEAYRKLIEQFQYTHEEVAKAVSKDRSTITNFLRLLKLPDAIQKSVSKGDLSMGHARALLGAESLSEQMRLFSLIVKKGLSVREIENLIRSASEGGTNRTKIKSPKDSGVSSAQEDLQKFLGTKVTIAHSKKRGKIIIEYYSLDDFDRVVQLIKK